ncbi:MAG: glycosyltransferase family 2 protein [Bacteroidota bacterium]
MCSFEKIDRAAKNMVDVSVIIVSYNIFDILDRCLKSIVEYSSGFSYEIIVIDNNSAEGDVHTITNKYDCVRLIKNDSNRGFAAANNQGIAIAQGEYILFLNNDTLFTENSIGMILNDYVRLTGRKGDYFIGCKLLNADGSHQISMFEYDTLWNCFTENFFLYKLFPRSRTFNKFYYNHIQISEPAEVEVVKGAFIFAPLQTIRKLGGFDERFFFYWEETDLCYRLKKLGGRVLYYPCTSIIHLGGISSGEMPWFVYKNQGRAKIQFYQKHFVGLKFVFAIIFHYTGLLMRIPIYLTGGILLLRRAQILKSFFYIRQLVNYPKNIFTDKY